MAKSFFSLGLHELHLATGEALSPSKHFKTIHFFPFAFLGVTFAHFDPDPDSADQKSMRIRIYNTRPNSVACETPTLHRAILL